MSLYSSMTEKVRAYERTAEAETWSEVAHSYMPASIALLSPAGARKESVYLEPEVTHIVRTPLVAEVYAKGQRLRTDAGLEYLVVYVRERSAPQPGMVVMGCAAAKAVLA